MRFDIFTLFPTMFAGPLGESILGRAINQHLFEVHLHNIRDWGIGRHHQVDDYTYGGGAGMVFRPEPVFAALESVLELNPSEAANPTPPPSFPIILLSPHGRVFNQKIARELAQQPRLALVCGHYEGLDERIRENLITDELSLGDFVLTGGELAAMVIVDAVARLLPNVLSEGSASEESHSRGLLEYPQYTRPADFRGWKIPDILVSGHHAKVTEWRFKESVRQTFQRRPDLLDQLEVDTLSHQERKWLEQVRPELIPPYDKELD
jgi:tRNA (guanine37-N1)-methyltransferase